MKDYINLFRVKHYIKNGIIFLPMFFGGALFDVSILPIVILGFISFCLISSAVYIFNDLQDIEKDRKHLTKKYRPLASGKISKRNAIILFCICIFVSLGINIALGALEGVILIATYLIVNILYSKGLKKIPVIDVVIVSSGFLIRMFYGGVISNILISKWLYLVVVSGSLYLALGKRRNEYSSTPPGAETRDVLSKYNVPFLDKNMYVFVALTDIFYTLWTLESPNQSIFWTAPLFMIIMMKYSLDVEGNSDGDPVEVIIRDKLLIGLVTLYGLLLAAFIYLA